MAALCAAGTLAASAAASPRHSFVLTLKRLSIGPHDYIRAFSIDTWRVEILATCHIPRGWSITAGNDVGTSGVIAGEASDGVTYLDRQHLRDLHSIALVQLNNPIRRQSGAAHDAAIPQTFNGTAEIGVYGLPVTSRKQHLTRRNVDLMPATRCPTPDE